MNTKDLPTETDQDNGNDQEPKSLSERLYEAAKEDWGDEHKGLLFAAYELARGFEEAKQIWCVEFMNGDVVADSLWTDAHDAVTHACTSLAEQDTVSARLALIANPRLPWFWRLNEQ